MARMRIDLEINNPTSVASTMERIAASSERAASSTRDQRVEMERLIDTYRNNPIARPMGGRAANNYAVASNGGRGAVTQRARSAPITQPEGVDKNTWQYRAAQAVLSSRINFGGVSPLVGRTAAIFGGGQGGMTAGLAKMLMNPFVAGMTVAVAGAVMLGKALYDLSEETSRVASAQADLRTRTYSSTSEAARLRALGISSSTSNSLLDRMSSDPVARGVGASMGITATPGPYGTRNSGRTTLQLVERLRKLRGDQQEIAMRILGAEELAPLLRVSEQTIERLKRSSDISSKIFDRDMERITAEYEQSGRELDQSWENLKAAIGKRAMPMIEGVKNWLSGAANTLASNLNGTPDGANTQAGRLASANAAIDRQVEAIDRNTDATLRMSKALGSSRGADAVPESIRSRQFVQVAMLGQSLL